MRAAQRARTTPKVSSPWPWVLGLGLVGLGVVLYQRSGSPVGAQTPALPTTSGGGGGGTIPYDATAVRTAQAALVRLHESLAVDGKLGPLTQAAIRRFQAHWSLPVSGLPDHATLASLASVSARA